MIEGYLLFSEHPRRLARVFPGATERDPITVAIDLPAEPEECERARLRVGEILRNLARRGS